MITIDREIKSLLELERFKAHHQIIMNIRQRLFDDDLDKKVSGREYIEFVKKLNREKDWRKYD